MDRIIEGLNLYKGEMLEYDNFFKEEKVRGRIVSLAVNDCLITIKLENVFKEEPNSHKWVNFSLEKEINIEHQFYLYSSLCKERKELILNSSLHGKEFKFYRQ